MARSILAVVSGFLFIALLSIATDFAIQAAMPDLFKPDGSTTSMPVLILTIGYVGLYATVGCYMAARMAPGRPMRHALVLGVLGLAFNVIGSWFRWNMAPVWYHVVSLSLVMFWAWIGGRMREQELAGAAPTSLPV